MLMRLKNLRLPLWALPPEWPESDGEPALAHLIIKDNKIISIEPNLISSERSVDREYDAQGALTLPGLIDAHVHLDKTYTRQRMATIEPGLLNAIAAMQCDQVHWDAQDLLTRSEKALHTALSNGCFFMRTHIDWNEQTPPLAWRIIEEQQHRWKDRIELQKVALVPLPMFKCPLQTEAIFKQVKESHNSIMGAFVHSSNFDSEAMSNLLHACQHHKIDLDLHIDEELGSTLGLEYVSQWLSNHNVTTHIVCGHACGLTQLDTNLANQLLDTLSQHNVSFITLPTTNLLLQDAQADRTPIQRGITLVHEISNRNIPVLIASDNVQDSFCSYGKYDPIEVLKLTTYSAQLTNVFDFWSQSVCRKDFLNRNTSYELIGQKANFIFFEDSDSYVWPEYERKKVMNNGRFIQTHKEI